MIGEIPLVNTIAGGVMDLLTPKGTVDGGIVGRELCLVERVEAKSRYTILLGHINGSECRLVLTWCRLLSGQDLLDKMKKRRKPKDLRNSRLGSKSRN